MHVTTQQKAVKKEKEKRKGLNLLCKPGETLVHSRFSSSFRQLHDNWEHGFYLLFLSTIEEHTQSSERKYRAEY
jgi:hypothetical protein